MRKQVYQAVIGLGLSLVMTAGGMSIFKEAVFASEAGWKQDQIGWWYQKEDGSYQKSGWFLDKNNWYYFDASGYMQTGWVQENGNWYYLNPVSDGTKGKMQTGWVKDGTSWYFTDENGKMQTGIIEVDQRTYYLNPSSNGDLGKVMSGNLNINGKEYYFDGSGAAVGNIPLADKSYKINGDRVEIVEKNFIFSVADSDYQDDDSDDDNDDDGSSSNDKNDSSDNTTDNDKDDTDNNGGNNKPDNKPDNDNNNTEDQTDEIHFWNRTLESSIKGYLRKLEGVAIKNIKKDDIKEIDSFLLKVGMDMNGARRISVSLDTTSDTPIYLASYYLTELKQMAGDLSYFIGLKKLKIDGGDFRFLENISNTEQVLRILSEKLPSVECLDIDMDIKLLQTESDNSLDLSSLEGWKNLKELYIENKNIDDISPLGNLRLLEKLDIRNNMISDITVLEELSHLKEVSLLGNPYIFDYHPVKNVEKLDVNLNEEGYVCIADIIDEDNVTMDLFCQYTGKKGTDIYADDLLEIEKFEVKEARYSNSLFAAEKLTAVITNRDGKEIEVTASGNTAESYQGFVFCRNMTHFLTEHNFDEEITVFGFLKNVTHLQLGQINNQGNVLICDRLILDFRALLNMP